MGRGKIEWTEENKQLLVLQIVDQWSEFAQYIEDGYEPYAIRVDKEHSRAMLVIRKRDDEGEWYYEYTHLPFSTRKGVPMLTEDGIEHWSEIGEHVWEGDIEEYEKDKEHMLATYPGKYEYMDVNYTPSES
jgi:hypothetical protein